MEETTPSGSPLHRGRVDYQAVFPLVQGELVGVVGKMKTKR